MSDQPATIEVWAEESGVRLCAERVAGGVQFTIQTSAGAVAATVTDYRVQRLAALIPSGATDREQELLAALKESSKFWRDLERGCVQGKERGYTKIDIGDLLLAVRHILKVEEAAIASADASASRAVSPEQQAHGPDPREVIIDATPDGGYARRILQYYRDRCNERTVAEPPSVLWDAMNQWQDERAAELDRALAALSPQESR